MFKRQTRLIGTVCAVPIILVSTTPIVSAATILQPTSTVVSVPSGSNDTSDPYTDDVLLNSLSFGNTTYDGTQGSFSVADKFEVETGRTEINAEWGDNDDGTDGDDTPFAKAGYPNADQETTDPDIQDATLLNAFNSRSLSEITDGEGSDAASSFRMAFSESLGFNDVGDDGRPDLVFFERGGNDTFDVELITGGSFANPEYSSAVTIDSGDFAEAGFSIDTVEITESQKMYVGGLDLAAFSLEAGDTAFGFRLSSAEGEGPDLGGFFLAAEDPRDFRTPIDSENPGTLISAVPLPASVWMLLAALGLGGAATRRRISG